jgi:SAM-dependent methyltransferase
MLTLPLLDFLATEAGAALLAELAPADLSETQTLPLLTRLRKHYSAEQAGAALTMARLRQKASAKFGADATRLFFTADALEQASDPRIRHYRAQALNGQTALDVGCGIGSDTYAIAQRIPDTLGIDRDELRIAIAEYNAAQLGSSARFVVGDITQTSPSADFIFYDPARRDGRGERLHHVEQYQPPLSLIQRWNAPHIAVKLSPGVALDQLAPYHGTLEFISVEGDLKEAVLWQDRTSPTLTRRATLLTATQTLQFVRTHDPQVSILAPQQWLVEPDPSILRAGLVQDLAATLNGALLDETIAYFTTADDPVSAWGRAWRIRAWLPYHLKKLRALLREHHIGRVTVKKRGSPITPEELQAALKLKGAQSATLVLTRYQGAPIVIWCDDLQTPR